MMMKKLIVNQPALTLGVLQAVLALAISFGLDLTADQVGAIMAVAAAIGALVVWHEVVPLRPLNELAAAEKVRTLAAEEEANMQSMTMYVDTSIPVVESGPMPPKLPEPSDPAVASSESTGGTAT